MQKTIIYILILGLLGFGVYYFIFSDKSPFSSTDAGFTVKDTGAIGKIFLAKNTGESILLERHPDGWTVNKQFKALTSPLNTLLQTLTRQTAAYPVTSNSYNNVIKDLSGTGIKVELYDRTGAKMRVFYVGGQVNGASGSYMLMEGSEQPFVVNVPGFEGYLTPRYPTLIEDWRDRSVFNTEAADIKSVSMQYDKEPLNSFTINQDDKGGVTVDLSPELKIKDTLNTRRAKLYLTYFRKIFCEGYTNGTPGMDSIIRSVPKRCGIDLTDKKGNNQHVDVYWRPIGRRSKNQLQSDKYTPDEYDSDRFYAVFNNNKDTAVIQVYSFYKFFHKGYEFYTEDGK